MILSIALPALLATLAAPLSDPPHVLFVRGAERSGGFFYQSSDANLTAQLADINDETSGTRNTGWHALAEALRADGFEVSQVVEPLEVGAPESGLTTGAPVPLHEKDLAAYDVIVMGSNNAAYGPEHVDAIAGYIERGGAVLFIADANFGSDWADSTASDQHFLDRFGWMLQQDQGTYALRRADGDFVAPDHPVLRGVDAFDGEGVSPVVVPVDEADGVRSEIIARARPGAQTRNNDGEPSVNNGRGSSRVVGERDAALAIGRFGEGAFAVHFDRNTFFNEGGQGTDITRLDNRRLALNLIRYLSSD